ncbi:short-chain fatty acyl-CoA regulator family protein [Corynebacterium uberis]|uniref:short-chain fatty acyl-CoA regulator family protein n=1 Tax=Corynebacterium uberis TaxID=2883169 RepID=UPI001D0A57AC|nr:short-chain fatty acyl-CoA regulator family protein [Corynebacterium uberis]UDL85140.1 short-chain fatty acyl-CoA regulator family protein [Corynebacterium uberis]
MTKLYAGGRIRTLRRSHGLTQAQMARRVNLSTSYLNQLENDQRPLTVPVLLTLTRTFGVPAEHFSGDAETHTAAQLADALPSINPTELTDLATRHPDIAHAILTKLNPPASPHPQPYEAVQDFFYQHRNYFPDLDADAEDFAARLGDPPLRLSRLAAAIDTHLGVSVRFTGSATGPRRHLDRDAGVLTLRRDLREAQMCFELALVLALETRTTLIDAAIAELHDPQAREVARLGMAQYHAAAVTMPYTAFRDRAEELHYDIELLSRHYGGGFEATCQRLSTLQRPGREGVPLFFVRTDRAGNISKRQSSTAFHVPRGGGSCPLWIIHRAFENPGSIVRQVAVMPDGRSYLWIARTVTEPAGGFGQPQKEFAVGLGCDLHQAHRLVYSRGLDLTGQSSTPIGPGCRACSRPLCPQRAFPQSGHRVVVSFSSSAPGPYATATAADADPGAPVVR